MINLKGAVLVKEEEGLRLKAYKCAARVYTIGYGHTSDSFFKVDKNTVITKEFAEKLFIHDIEEAEAVVKEQFPDWELLNENQYAAIVSFAYNTGSLKFKRNGKFLDRTILIHLKNHSWARAAASFGLYNKDIHGKKLAGLVKRRENEKALFLTPPLTLPVTPPLPPEPFKPKMTFFESFKEMVSNVWDNFWYDT